MDERSAQKTTTAESFDGRVDGYRTSETHGEGEDLVRLARWCDGATWALDVATGAGHTAGALRRAGVPNVIASDASPSMVATSRESFPGVDGVVADAERLPFAADSFDAVTCRIAAHHFPAPETFVAEVARVIRPDGVFAFEDNVAPEDDALGSFLDRFETLRDPTHVESRSASTWQRWIADAGFSIEETDRIVKTVAFTPWVDRIPSLEPEDREEIHRLLLDAPEEAAERFHIRYDDGEVQSFASAKTLIRAVRTR